MTEDEHQVAPACQEDESKTAKELGVLKTSIESTLQVFDRAMDLALANENKSANEATVEDIWRAMTNIKLV